MGKICSKESETAFEKVLREQETKEIQFCYLCTQQCRGENVRECDKCTKTCCNKCSKRIDLCNSCLSKE